MDNAKLEVLRKTRAYHIERVDLIDAEIAEVETAKPKLRHTDFGWDANGIPCGAVDVFETQGLRVVGTNTVCSALCDDPTVTTYKPVTVAFNAMDDLVELAKPLKEFLLQAIGAQGSDGIIGKIKDGVFTLGVSKRGRTTKWMYDSGELAKLILNLRRLVATAEKEQNDT